MKHKKLLPIPVALLGLFLSCLLLLTGCGKENTAAENAITSVAVSRQGEITVKAVLTDEFLNSYVEKKVYLFELPSYCTDPAVEIREREPVAEIKPKAEVSCKISAEDGTRSRLYSSFLLASYDSADDDYTPITPPLAVTDLADMTPPPAKENGDGSIKGLISDHPADAIRLGVAHTILDVPMEKLILKGWQEGALPYIYNGVTRYLQAAELDKLDGLVEAYASAGVKVYLRFSLGEPLGNPNVPGCLYVPGQEGSSVLERSYAVNMYDPAAAEIMEGFFGFMAERYAFSEEGDPLAASFILGYHVNDTALHHVGGTAEVYEKLVRVAHTALRSRTADGQVYVSLNSLQLASTEENLQDVPTFLQAFSEACALRGDYDWNIACELYSHTNAIWEKNSETDDRFYTVHSLRNLTDCLQTEDYRTPTGEVRRLIISGFSVNACPLSAVPTAEDYTKQAASYAFAYLTCVENGSVEALIYSRYADYHTPGLGNVQLHNGLWGRNGEGVITTPYPLYGIFKKMDTSAFSALAGGLSAIIDTPYTRLEHALAGRKPPVTLVEGTASLEGFSPDHSKATPLFTFDSGSLCGFEGASALTYMELSRMEALGTVILYNRFERRDTCDPMAITVPVSAAELMGSERLVVDLYAGAVKAAEAGGIRPTVTLRMTCKGSAGAMIYEASVAEVSGGMWQSAVFEVKDFVALLEGSEEITLTLLMDYDPAASVPGAHHMGIAGIYLMSPEAPAGLSVGVILAIVGGVVAVVAAAGCVLFLRSRRRR